MTTVRKEITPDVPTPDAPKPALRVALPTPTPPAALVPLTLPSSPPSPARTPVENLARLEAATRKRNYERPIVDYGMLDLSRVPEEQRAALEFLVVNMTFIERESTPNLASLARCAPIPEVSRCFTAQIEDEVAHGDMLVRWLAVAGIEGEAERGTRFGVKAAELTQHHAWLGIKNAEILTEHYASALIDEMLLRIEEPCLSFVLAQIQKDEQRHKVIAIESVRALRDAGRHKSFIARIFGPIVEIGTVRYFRHVFGGYLAKQCAPLALPHRQILERALDEVHDALRDARA